MPEACERLLVPHSFPPRRSSDLRAPILPDADRDLLDVPDSTEVAEPADRVVRARHLYGPWSRGHREGRDRKSTRLNSSHLGTSYPVFCWNKQMATAGTARVLERQ